MAELEQRLAHVSAERQRLRAELLRAERGCDGVRAALRARGVEPVEQREGPTPDVAAEVALRAAAWELAGGSGVDALRPLPDQMRYPWFVQGLEHISNAVAACRADTA